MTETTYYRRKAMNLCTYCGAPRGESSSEIYCEACRQLKAAENKEYKNTYLKAEPAVLFEYRPPYRGLLEAPAPPAPRERPLFGQRRDELAHLRGE